ncbi:protein FAM207A [Trichomycterus rosablanca]|uniref:protein FAM207A n=1 Tax=Trichomycterus rosablanca TaxID=2290929 RepID=UPI002F351E4A
MVGKIKRTRQKLHQEAVKIDNANKNTLPSLENIGAKIPALPLNLQKATKLETRIKTADIKTKNEKAFNFPKGIFAGTVIPPEALVQTLQVAEPSTVQPTAEQQKGSGEKKQQSKKEKMKERRQRWLNKISAIKLAHEQQAELKRRKATPVVGDMRSLADALPELSHFIKTSATRKQRRVVIKKEEPSDYCQMKPAQKRKLLETEMSRFSEAMKDSTFKVNPLAAIGEHLRKRLKQEDEQS